MATEGFWSKNDVKFTAAWLQDLVSVGYQQPSLLPIGLHQEKRKTVSKDRKEFVPQKLPSVHLGVEESGTVNYEIGNLIRWRKSFANIQVPTSRTTIDQNLAWLSKQADMVKKVDFVDLVDLVGKLDIHHIIAVPMFFMAMDLPQNFDSVLNKMIYRSEASSFNSQNFYSAHVPAVHPWTVSNEADFVKLIRLVAAGDPLLMELLMELV
ncbi:hypothetical protein ACH5RR_000850 [Cinchona calisaya]|uniref:Uncharacterized protein n=1 Tax=Cinchona calisaya TaxID=153742 RepID=A0ABD3B2W5_9GENT